MYYKNITQTKASPILQVSTQLKPGSIGTDAVSGTMFSFRQKEEQLLPLREKGFFFWNKEHSTLFTIEKKIVWLNLVFDCLALTYCTRKVQIYDNTCHRHLTSTKKHLWQVITSAHLLHQQFFSLGKSLLLKGVTTLPVCWNQTIKSKETIYNFHRENELSSMYLSNHWHHVMTLF